MATVKRLNDIYTIDTTDVYLTGNLHVIGVYDTTNVTNTNVQDKDISLNVGETGWGVGGNSAPGTSGLIVDRGLQANVSIRWNEVTKSWEFSNDGATYNGIAASAISSTTLTGNVLQLNNSVSPGVVANASVVYSSIPGEGTSGVYVLSGAATDEELITKRRALGFSLIL
jgi:hypothetical protein